MCFPATPLRPTNHSHLPCTSDKSRTTLPSSSYPPSLPSLPFHTCSLPNIRTRSYPCLPDGPSSLLAVHLSRSCRRRQIHGCHAPLPIRREHLGFCTSWIQQRYHRLLARACVPRFRDQEGRWGVYPYGFPAIRSTTVEWYLWVFH